MSGAFCKLRQFCLLGLLFVWGAAGASAQTVSFDPANSVPTEPVFTVSLDIDCAGLDVKGVELQVAYDPFVVRLDAITPGSWYAGSGQNFYFYDYTGTAPQGVIHLASAVLDGALTGQGELAVCHFTILDFGISPLVFQNVDVRGWSNTDLGFGHSTGDKITLDPVVADRQTAFGTVKALFR